MFFFFSFFLLVYILVSVAFFTPFERKILGYIYLPSGPNSVGLMGLFQPFSDALSLFSSEHYFLVCGNYFIYYFVPILGLMNSLVFFIIMSFF